MTKIFLIFLLVSSSSFAYESEDELKVVLTGKIAKFITWQGDGEAKFVITVIKNPYKNLFEKKYKNKKIKNKPVLIKYIDDISDLSFTNILYIPKVTSKELSSILKKTTQKNILTVSTMRAFAQKGGAVQLFFVSQKGRLKINLDVIKKENFKVKSSFIRISEVVKGMVY